MNSSFTPPLLALTLAAGAALAGCASTPVQEQKPDAPAITMTPLPPSGPAAPPPPTTSVDPAPTPLPTATLQSSAGDAFYRVLPGDTGVKISRKHHLALPDLLALNPDVQWNRLKVGQLVRVRTGR